MQSPNNRGSGLAAIPKSREKMKCYILTVKFVNVTIFKRQIVKETRLLSEETQIENKFVKMRPVEKKQALINYILLLNI